jgi:pimeloyl-ACP methyl ester carboxylesterase
MSDATPTIVFVHGAFADAWSWKAVWDEIRGDGYDIKAPPNPLRGLVEDAAYIRSFVEQIEGPVLLVGHSYGGAVITVAGVSPRVVGLVYVAGFAPDEGENLVDLQAQFPDSKAVPTYRPAPFPGDGVEYSLDPVSFPEVFANDVSTNLTEFMAIAQRPLSAAAFGQPAPAAAWRSKPTWAVFPTEDGAINPEVHRFSYDRAGAAVTEVVGASHAVALSHPEIVGAVIREALQVLAAQPVEAYSGQQG